MTTLADDFDVYLHHGRAIGWAPATMAGYQHLLRVTATFCRQRGCLRAADVSPADLEALMAVQYDEGWSQRSRLKLAILLRTTFRWLHDQGRLISDPALSLPLPNDGEEELPAQPLSEAEVQAIFASLPRASAIDLRNAAMLELLYGCGLRCSEVFALDVDDLDLSRRTLHVRKSKWGQERLLPLMGTAMAAVQDFLALRRTLLKGPDRGALFLSLLGGRVKKGVLYSVLDQLNAVRGPEAQHLHPHLFRHSIAVHLCEAGPTFDTSRRSWDMPT
jgi:site-specific recombinase XerD